MRIGNLGCSYHIFHCSAFHTESYIVENGVVEQYWFLVHIAHQTAQAVDFQVTQVGSVYLDAAFSHVVESRNQVHERGFSGSGLTHNSDGVAFLHSQVDVIQYLAVRAIGESDVLECDSIIESVSFFRLRFLCDGAYGIEDFIDSLY